MSDEIQRKLNELSDFGTIDDYYTYDYGPKDDRTHVMKVTLEVELEANPNE